ncbi:hypothetical protein BJ742DRAFT_879712 [Cladochytrium replicatum]|nr:hypothetical protein BJ742DRAFT_879712 [Cladochytrium replicatum]
MSSPRPASLDHRWSGYSSASRRRHHLYANWSSTTFAGGTLDSGFFEGSPRTSVLGAGKQGDLFFSKVNESVPFQDLPTNTTTKKLYKAFLRATSLDVNDIEMSRLVTSLWIEPRLLLWWRGIAATWMWGALLVFLGTSAGFTAVNDAATLSLLSVATFFTLLSFHMIPFVRYSKIQPTTDNQRLLLIVTSVLPVSFAFAVSLMYFTHFLRNIQDPQARVSRDSSFKLPHTPSEWFTCMNVMIITPALLVLEMFLSLVPMKPTSWHVPTILGIFYLFFFELTVIAFKPKRVFQNCNKSVKLTSSRFIQGPFFIALLIVFFFIAAGLLAVRDSLCRDREARLGGAILGRHSTTSRTYRYTPYSEVSKPPSAYPLRQVRGSTKPTIQIVPDCVGQQVNQCDSIAPVRYPEAEPLGAFEPAAMQRESFPPPLSAQSSGWWWSQTSMIQLGTAKEEPDEYDYQAMCPESWDYSNC